MRTHLRESMLALLLIGILATGCDTGTKKASENSITFEFYQRGKDLPFR